MTIAQLENRIREIINNQYEAIYTGKLEVEKTKDGYILKIWLNRDPLDPLSMYIQGDEDFFIKYVEKEISKRQLDRITYYTGYKIYLDGNAKKGFK